MKSLKVVHLIWEDSESVAEWTPREDLGERLELTHSVGFLLKETADFLLLALSFDPETDSVNNFKKIPRAAIKKRRTICRISLMRMI